MTKFFDYKGPLPDRNSDIVVWFSCGAASAVAARVAVQLFGDVCRVRVVNNPVAEEDEDNRRFLSDVADWLGVEIESCINPSWPNCSAVEVWDSESWMSGVAGAPCTGELKKRARQHWERHNVHDWMVLGFTSDEQSRHTRFVESERANVLPLLLSCGISKQDCYNYLRSEGLVLPRMYTLGFPNANCVGCSKASSPTYWNHVRKHYPEVFHARAEQSRRLGCRLVRHRGQRIFLDELPPTARGYSMRGSDTECGIFCEEKGAWQ